MKPQVKIGRVYDDTSAKDGMRVLVDRVWPRGMKKEAAHLDRWAKAVAPSPQLRTWYSHDPEKFDEFRRRYSAELGEPERAEAFKELRELAHAKPLLLLTASRDLEHSQAAVLADKLR